MKEWLTLEVGDLELKKLHADRIATLKHIDTKFIKLDAKDDMNHSIEMILEFA
ncbi:hypothetical protein JHK84_045439 [Glycine max]|nr:hypothetical protein JHK86_045388 [Glycine max]KAG4952104.1 hypothetical protein JHK85_045971 [Glycine max]KAG5108532.1 hypothetical protein JHK84_045439 [Glycine max]